MSHYDVSLFLFNFNHDAAVRSAYKADPLTAADGYNLTEEERDAVAKHDFGALYAMDVHPLLLIYMANNLAVPPHEYVASVRGQPAPALH